MDYGIVFLLEAIWLPIVEKYHATQFEFLLYEL